MKQALLVLSLLVALAAPAAQATTCMQASEEGAVAEGRLSVGQFEDATGRPERAYILTLPAPTCLAGSDEMDNVDDAGTVHVFSSDDALQTSLEGFVGNDVQVRGTPMGAHTAHHHAPIIMDVSEIDAL